MKLQVKINGKWEYVFCRNELKQDPITTKEKRKALDIKALAYFKMQYANHEFRLE